MICPVCKKNMIVVEYRDVELDYCTGCRGVWFDSDELSLLFKSAGLEDGNLSVGALLSAAECQTLEKTLKCPICARRMRKTALGEAPKVTVDVCRKGDGLWFDGGEIARLAGQRAGAGGGEAGSQRRILSYLEDLFRA